MCLPYLKFSEPLPETHLFFLFGQVNTYYLKFEIKLALPIEIECLFGSNELMVMFYLQPQPRGGHPKQRRKQMTTRKSVTVWAPSVTGKSRVISLDNLRVKQSDKLEVSEKGKQHQAEILLFQHDKSLGLR